MLNSSQMLKSNPKMQRMCVPGRVTDRLRAVLILPPPPTTLTKPPGASRHLWAAAPARRVFPEEKKKKVRTNSFPPQGTQLPAPGIGRDLVRRSVSLPAPGQSSATPATRGEEPAPARPPSGAQRLRAARFTSGKRPGGARNAITERVTSVTRIPEPTRQAQAALAPADFHAVGSSIDKSTASFIYLFKI